MTTSLPIKFVKRCLAAAMATTLLSFGALSTVPAPPDRHVTVAGKDLKTSAVGRKIG